MARIETSGYVPTHITGATTTAVFVGSGTLIAVIVNTTSSQRAITVADGSSTVASLKASVTEGAYVYNCSIGNGLTITAPDTSGDYTVIWTKS